MSNTTYRLYKDSVVIETTEACHIERAIEYFEELGYSILKSEYTIGRVEYDPWDNWHPSYDFGTHSVSTMRHKEPQVSESPSDSIQIGASGAYAAHGHLRHSER
jgi:hypothetical protein